MVAKEGYLVSNFTCKFTYCCIARPHPPYIRNRTISLTDIPAERNPEVKLTSSTELQKISTKIGIYLLYIFRFVPNTVYIVRVVFLIQNLDIG